MAHSSKGSIDEAKIVKAGCGLRYDPEQLGDDVGFDFSAVKTLRDNVSAITDENAQDDNQQAIRQDDL
jgi:hypothetical protein